MKSSGFLCKLQLEETEMMEILEQKAPGEVQGREEYLEKQEYQE